MSIWLKIPLWILAIWLLLSLFVYFVQRRMQYFPDTEAVAPGPGREDVTLTAADGTRVKATWWPGARDATIILFHGNAGSRRHRLGIMGRLHKLGWSILLLDYRGYGGSEGDPTQEGLIQDGVAAAKWLRESRPDDRMVFFGESIGASVAIQVAAIDRPDAMVVQNGAYSILEVAKGHYPFLPVSWIMKDTWEARGTIERLDVPMLFIHGRQDRIVPIEHGRALYDAAPGKKEWWEIERGHHNDVPEIAMVRWETRIHDFLEEVIR